MSLMRDGQLRDDWQEALSRDGEFVRMESQFRNWITPDGSPGPSGEGGFRAEAGRYHLYVSHACPWANRTTIMRRLKGLEDVVGLDLVEPEMPDEGWFFAVSGGRSADSVNGFRHAHQLYTLARPDYSGLVTVPILWDKQRRTIVNNESSEIIRMFNSAFGDLAPDATDYYPPDLREEIDTLNDRIYADVNNGVYRCGFARTQRAYERAFDRLFAALDEMDALLGHRRYLLGERVTEADWRLFTTLVRFDAVYYLHFKCNLRRIADYPNLSPYLRELYQWPGVAETVDFDHIKRHYFRSHPQLNPGRIVPKGPAQDLLAPHDRARVSGP